MRRFYPPTESDIPMHGWRPYSDAHQERIRAHQKRDGNGESMERKEWLDPAWLPVLTEELGEVAKVFNDVRHNGVLPTDALGYVTMRELARAELVQVTAMAAAWIDAIDLDTCYDVYASRGSVVNDREDGEPVTCCLPTHHDGKHLDWSGRHRWT